jgi:hypothetical protein
LAVETFCDDIMRQLADKEQGFLKPQFAILNLDTQNELKLLQQRLLF